MKAISAKRICAALIVLLLVAGAVLAAVCSGGAGEADAASLRQGSTGDKVSEMQRKLKNWGYYDGAVDGIRCRGNSKIGVTTTARWTGYSVRGRARR